MCSAESDPKAFIVQFGMEDFWGSKTRVTRVTRVNLQSVVLTKFKCCVLITLCTKIIWQMIFWSIFHCIHSLVLDNIQCRPRQTLITSIAQLTESLDIFPVPPGEPTVAMAVHHVQKLVSCTSTQRNAYGKNRGTTPFDLSVSVSLFNLFTSARKLILTR